MNQPQMTKKLPPYVERELKIYMGKVLDEMETMESDDFKIGHLLNEIAAWKIQDIFNNSMEEN